ncbi:unnamed protein product [Prorocentrum cordatum]|uniref:Uncharacterized protein n=1 Tax=Prorocentrum cordatum TaxID=2364126 RepID=A0ABN9WYN5_9DINO|nr:unnamed protein product [Polarella glacialis]
MGLARIGACAQFFCSATLARVTRAAEGAVLLQARCWPSLPPGHDTAAVDMVMSWRRIKARAAGAFENALPDVAKYSKRNAGSQPGDLGLQVRKLNRFDTTDGPALKECGPGPNCFSTTFDPEDVACSTALRPWSPPPGTPAAEALAQLREEIAGYPPGQNGVDGGGFRVITAQDNYRRRLSRA